MSKGERGRRRMGKFARVNAKIGEIRSMIKELEDYFTLNPESKGDFERQIISDAKIQAASGELNTLARIKLSKLYHNVIGQGV